MKMGKITVILEAFNKQAKFT